MCGNFWIQVLSKASQKERGRGFVRVRSSILMVFDEDAFGEGRGGVDKRVFIREDRQIFGQHCLIKFIQSIENNR